MSFYVSKIFATVGYIQNDIIFTFYLFLTYFTSLLSNHVFTNVITVLGVGDDVVSIYVDSIPINNRNGAKVKWVLGL